MKLPSMHTETIIMENESVVNNMWKSFDHSVTDKFNYTMRVWNHVWSQIDITATSTSDYYTWECFGEIDPVKESPFITDLPTAAIHLAKIKQTSILPLLPAKVKLIYQVSIL